MREKGQGKKRKQNKMEELTNNERETLICLIENEIESNLDVIKDIQKIGVKQ